MDGTTWGDYHVVGTFDGEVFTVAEVGPFAISMGLVDAPADGTATVNIWQANIRKKIVNHVPMSGGEVEELGEFQLDVVAFPAAEIQLEFLDPADDEGGDGGPTFPTGNHIDVLDVPGLGKAASSPWACCTTP